MRFPAFEPIDLKNTLQSMDVVDLPISKIIPDGDQPRKIFSDSSIEDMALSIKKHGVIQPVLVRINDDNKYILIAGERRWRAAKLAGLERIPAIIKNYDKASRMAIALIENIQRENLNPLDEAQAIQSLIDECYMTHGQVAESLGKSRTTITNLLRLLTLENTVKEKLNLGLLEMGHARALLSLTGTQQIDAAEIIVKKSLSVRETEKLTKMANSPKMSKLLSYDTEYAARINELSLMLSKKISSKVNISFKSNGKGQVVLNFDTLEDAEDLMYKLMSGCVDA
jgi:ParB family chromosome partitioning protein